MNNIVPKRTDVLLPYAEGFDKNFFFFLVAITAWRLLYLIITPLDLVPDEAYYWHWGTHPALGYYSKPPLIAWVNTVTTHLVGSSTFSVRLPAVVFSTLGLIALYKLSSRIYDQNTGLLSVILASFTPAACILSFIMTIDAPLMFFWITSLYFLYRALEGDGNNWLWWIGLGISCGFGILSKQMMLIFPVLTFMFFILSKKSCGLAKKPHFFVMTLIAFLFLLPPLYWNWKHKWVTISHTTHHFLGNPSFWYWLKTSGDFLGGQLFLMSPITFVLFVWISVTLFISYKKNDDDLRFLLIFSLLPLIGFFLMSFRQRINANWPAVFYPPGIILTAAWLNGHIHIPSNLEKWDSAKSWAIRSGAFLIVVTYGLTFLFSLPLLSGADFDPFKRLKGWRELGEKVASIVNISEKPQSTFLLAPRRQIVSELAFYGPDSNNVYMWNDNKNIIHSQYDLWPGPKEKIGWNCLFITPEDYKPSNHLIGAFDSFGLLDTIYIEEKSVDLKSYNIFWGRSLRKWPY